MDAWTNLIPMLLPGKPRHPPTLRSAGRLASSCCAGSSSCFVGLFLAVFSDNRLSLFLSIAMAVAGALMSLPHMVAAAVSRR